MADEAAHVWAIAKFVSAIAGDSQDADLLTATEDLAQSAGRHIERIQKVLTQMNIQLANVLSDVSGMTGQAINKAILAG